MEPHDTTPMTPGQAALTNDPALNVDDLRSVLRAISADVAQDVDDFEGAPFNGATVADYIGKVAAQVDVLARVVLALVDVQSSALVVGPDDGVIVTMESDDEDAARAVVKLLGTILGHDRFAVFAGADVHKLAPSEPLGPRVAQLEAEVARIVDASEAG